MIRFPRQLITYNMCYNDRLTQVNVMDTKRRYFLQTSAAAGAVGLFVPPTLFANWPQDDFAITEFEQAVQKITGGREVVEGSVDLQAPAIAENGAQVRVEVMTDLKDVQAINLLVEKNPVSLTSRFLIGPHNVPYAATNLKVRETSRILALVETSDKFYSASREVRVTAGGCS